MLKNEMAELAAFAESHVEVVRDGFDGASPVPAIALMPDFRVIQVAAPLSDPDSPDPATVDALLHLVRAEIATLLTGCHVLFWHTRPRAFITDGQRLMINLRLLGGNADHYALVSAIERLWPQMVPKAEPKQKRFETVNGNVIMAQVPSWVGSPVTVAADAPITSTVTR